MRIIGLDPGYDRLGVAVMEHGARKETLLHSECFTTDKSASFEERLAQIGAKVHELIATYEPDALALERLFFSKNQRTAMRVAEVRGTLLYLAESHSCKVYEYTPQEVKVAVTGYGKSDKEQVERMVRRLVPEARADALDDEYDAIAVAVTCLASVR